MIIYPSKTIIRDTDRAFEIDDNDPEFLRDPTGLFAIYYGVEPPMLLRSTETDNEWDVIARIWAYHFEKLSRLFGAAREGYIGPVTTHPPDDWRL